MVFQSIFLSQAVFVDELVEAAPTDHILFLLDWILADSTAFSVLLNNSWLVLNQNYLRLVLIDGFYTGESKLTIRTPVFFCGPPVQNAIEAEAVAAAGDSSLLGERIQANWTRLLYWRIPCFTTSYVLLFTGGTTRLFWWGQFSGLWRGAELALYPMEFLKVGQSPFFE